MTITRKLILAGIIVAGLPALVSTGVYANEGYWVDSAGTIVKSGTGLCWHTIFWTPALAVEGCDPVAKEEEKPQPKMSEIMPSPPPAPLTQPQLSPVQAKLIPTKINFSDEDLFSFNESVLKPKGTAMLDELAQDLDGATYEVINVTGYTDRIGSVQYNQRLSMRRADVVKDYLVNKGIPADRIRAEGKGKTQPITQPSDCMGMKRTKVIACLQPDRRTEVTVVGTKQTVANLN